MDTAAHDVQTVSEKVFTAMRQSLKAELDASAAAREILSQMRFL